MTIQVYPAAKSQVTSNFWRYTAVGGETTLTGVDNSGTQLYYYPNQEQVFLNGVLLVRGVDYTATSGTSITGLAALVAGDTVQVNCYSNFTITQVPVTALQGSVTNLQLANSSFTIGSTLINLGDTKNTIAGLTLTAPTINNQIAGTQYSTSVPLTVKAAAGQAVNLQEWQNSSGTALSAFGSSGALGINTAPTAATLALKTFGDRQIDFINGSGSTVGYIGTSGAFGSAGTDDLRFRSDSNNIVFGFSGFEKLRLTSSPSLIMGGFTTGTPPTSAKIYVNNGINENIGNPTYGGSLVINEYSSSLNATMGIEFKTRADGNGSGWRISSLANNPDFVFESRSNSATWTEKMRIDYTGKLAIGTTSPAAQIDILVPTGSVGGIRVGSAGTAERTINTFYNSNATSPGGSSMTIRSHGPTYVETLLGVSMSGSTLILSDVGLLAIGTYTTSPLVFGVGNTEKARFDANSLLVGYTTNQNTAYKLQVNSQIFATSSSIATSDGKFKENVNTINNGLQLVDALNPVSFNWKKHNKHNFVEGKTVGFIAQEVREALKDYEWVDNIVKENKDGETGEEFLGLVESHIIPLLVSAVKELSAKVKKLEAKNV